MRHRDIPSPRRRRGHSAERPVLRRMLDQRAAPDARLELGKIEQRAVGLQDQMKIARQQLAAEIGVERALVVRVMIAGDHHHRHRGPRDLAEREAHRALADAAGVEQIADDQQQVRVALIGYFDHAAERAPHPLAQRVAGRTVAEAVGFEMHVRSVNDTERSPRSGGQALSPAGSAPCGSPRPKGQT